MTRKRILFLYLGFLALLVPATCFALRETGVERTFVENLLAKVLVRDRFRLDAAAFDLSDGSVTLRGLRITTREEDAARARAEVEQVVVGVETNPLGEVGSLRSVRIRGLTLDIDMVDGRFPDFAALLQRDGSEPSGDDLPAVEVVDSTLSLRLAPDAPRLSFTELDLRLLPEEDARERLVLSGSMRAPGGHRVEVVGRGDRSLATFRVELRLRDLPLDPELARPYSDAVAEQLAAIELGGIAKSIVVHGTWDGRATDGQRLKLGAQAEVADLRCAFADIPHRLVGATAQLRTALTEPARIEFEVHDESVDGNLALRGIVRDPFADRPALSLQLDASDVLVGPKLGEGLAKIPAAARVWDAFQPNSGRVDANLRLDTETAEADERVQLELALNGIGARFRGFAGDDGQRGHGFPFPLSNVTGRVSLKDGEVSIEDVRAELGEYEVFAGGHVLPQRDGATEIQIDIDSPELAFSTEVRDALAELDPDFAAVYDEYAPQGAAAVEVSIRSGAAQGDQGVRVRIRPLGASAAWVGFPCRIEQITGVVDIGDDGVVIDLDGTRGASTVALDGRFPATAGTAVALHEPAPAALLRIDATALRIDSELLAAMRTLSTDLGRTIDFLGASGVADVDLDVWRDFGDAEFGYDVRVDLADGAIELATLPLPTRKLSGPIFVHGQGGRSRIEVGGVQGLVDHGGSRPSSPIVVQGTVGASEAGYESDLTAVIRGLELNERLGAALDEFGAFDLEAWNLLRVSGDVDVVWRQTKRIDEPTPHQELRIQLMGVRSGAEFLPAPAEQIFGDVQVYDGVATFRGVRATMAGAQVHCPQGSAWHDEDEAVFEARVSSDDFPVDDRLANLLDGPLAQTYLDREVRGRVRVHQLSMQLRFPDDGRGFRSKLSGRLTALGLRMMLGAEVSEITGSWTIDDAEFDKGGGTVRGRVEAAGFELFHHRATDATARFDASPEQVRFGGVRLRLHGGQVSGASDGNADLVYTLGDPGKLALDLEWDGISLTDIARAAGISDNRFRGNLAGGLRLTELHGADIVHAVGDGRLRITNGDLGQVPAFTAIYSYLEEPRRPRFEDLAVDFRIADERVTIPRFEVSSPLLTATGSGSIGMGGYIDMRIDFPDFFGKSADWLFIPQVLRVLTNELARFQVYGYLRAPKTQPLWLWRESAPRVPLGPIPAAPAEDDDADATQVEDSILPTTSRE